jgi:hypothetical protein
MPEPSRLELALVDACDIARKYGTPADLTPDDFALQRSSPGWQHATHIGPEHLISVTLDPDGDVTVQVGEIYWFDEEDDDEEAAGPECFHGRPLTDVYLPGDAPGPQHAEVVDGTLVHGDQPLTDETRAAIATVISAARASQTR